MNMQHKRYRRISYAFALLCACALAASAAVPESQSEAALGADGKIYMARTGPLGELFPNTTAPDRTVQALALDVIQAGGAVERLLVPETDGTAIERAPSVLYEEDTNTVFVVWESEQNIHPLIKLASYDGRRWSRPVQVTGNAYAPKTSPQIAITRDSYRAVEADSPNGAPVLRHRTILHLLWGEETTGGLYSTFYSPVILEDGTYIGWNPIYNLNNMVGAADPATSFEPSPLLVRAPAIQAGSDDRTVIAAFASSVTRRLTTVEIDVLPRELIRLGDNTRSTIVDVGLRANSSAALRTLAERARAAIFEKGSAAFHQEVLQVIADEVFEQMVAGGPQPGIVSIADNARSTIVDVGAKFSRRGLRANFRSAPAGLSAVRQIPPTDPEFGPVDPSAEMHVLRFRVASSRPAPRVGTAPVTLFVAESGENVVVSWEEPGKILYRDSREDGWEDTRELRISPALPLDRAYEILQQRVRNR